MISVEKLRRFPLFSGLDLQTLTALAMAGHDTTVEAGTWLFLEGEKADSFYLIMNGTIDLKMSVNSGRHEQADLVRLTEYEAFGWSALVQPHTYTLSALTDEDSHLLVIDSEKMLALMDQDSNVGYKLMTRMAETIRRRLTNMHTRFVSLTTVP